MSEQQIGGGEVERLRSVVADLHGHLSRIEDLVGADTRAATARLHHQGPRSAELRWPVASAVAVAIALQVLLPQRLSIGPSWILPALEAALFVGLSAANPKRIDRRSALLRAASIALIAVTSLANGWSSARLIDDLISGTGPKAAGPLLAHGASIYLTNVIVFSLWYWEMDRGGPVDRALGAGDELPDLLFPQQGQPDVAPAGWRPTYFDYLYTSYTNATAFSPTDVLPLTHRAKALMGLQSSIALATVALVVARAVNILS